MTFEQYCAVIEATARVHGYGLFLPSLYETEPHQKLHVYDALPATGNEEAVARAWAQTFMSQGETVYLACRGENGVINVFEFVQGSERRCKSIIIDGQNMGC